jgi:hypothetical protein
MNQLLYSPNEHSNKIGRHASYIVSAHGEGEFKGVTNNPRGAKEYHKRHYGRQSPQDCATKSTYLLPLCYEIPPVGRANRGFLFMPYPVTPKARV